MSFNTEDATDYSWNYKNFSNCFMNINTLKKYGFHYCSRNLNKKYLLKNKSLMIKRINIQGLSVGEFLYLAEVVW